MKKRMTAALLILSLLCLSACSKPAAPAESSAPDRTVAAAPETTAAAAQPASTAAPETTAAKPAEAAKPTEAAKPAAPVQTAPKEEAPAAEGIVPVRVRVEMENLGSYMETEFYKTISTTRQSFILEEADAKKYPQLQKALEDYRKEIDDGKVEIMSDLAANYNGMKEYRSKEEMPDMLSEDTASVIRADSRVLSTLREVYSYYGGAHPDYFFHSRNYDTRTGRRLKLEDVIKDKDAFYDLCLQKVKEAYPTEFQYMVDPENSIRTGDYENDISWTVGNEGMTVYFNSYVLGPYAMGRQFIYISYEEAPNLFEKKYAEAPKDYAVPLKTEIPVSVSVNGKTQTVRINEEAPEEEYGYTKWTIHCGDREFVLDNDCYYQESYLVCVGGHPYVYSFETSDNDYSILFVVDLEKMSSECFGNAALSGGKYDYVSDDTSYKNTGNWPAFTDPSSFRMSARVEVLSTTGGERDYHAGADGLPVPDQEWFEIRGGHVLRTLAEVQAERVDADGKVSGSISIPSGSYLLMVRSDGNWMDFQEVDGSRVEVYEVYDRMFSTNEQEDPSKVYYRVTEDSSDYPPRVNGKDAMDLFEGIMYAG